MMVLPPPTPPPPPPPPPPEVAEKRGVPLGVPEGVSLPDPATQEDGVKVAGVEGEEEVERLAV